jgi:plasmid stabilization system protein ParE
MENMGIQFRELTVGFGDSGYLLYYGIEGDEVTILAVRHAREAGY